MTWWPFNKKKPESKIEDIIKPYEYLGSDVRVKPHTPCFNRHVIIMTGACVKYMEDKT